MRGEQTEHMCNGRGFVAALDQSGGSTPKALRRYGIAEDAYRDEEEMFDLVHEMRERIVTSRPSTVTGSWPRSCSRRPWTAASWGCPPPTTCGRRST